MAAKDEGIKIRKKSTQRIAVKLTDRELLDYGKALAQSENDIRSEREQQDAMRAGMKETLQRIESRRMMLAGLVSSGEEYREIDCDDVFDYDTGRVTRHRLDTGEVVIERPMTDEERQRSIALVGGPR